MKLQRRARPRLRAALAPLALVGLLAACASNDYEVPEDYLRGEPELEESTPLGGAALAQRKRDMRRAHSDLLHFHTTLESLRHRRDRGGFFLFSGFMDAYIGLHLDSLLRSEWQSQHPEVMALDASLRLAKAELLIRMRDPGRAQDVVDEIRDRFQGRENMLVEYPIGEQSTLRDALEIVGERKWWRS